MDICRLIIQMLERLCFRIFSNDTPASPDVMHAVATHTMPITFDAWCGWMSCCEDSTMLTPKARATMVPHSFRLSRLDSKVE